MRRDLISPQTARSLEEVSLFSTRTTFYTQKYHKKTLFQVQARARPLLSATLVDTHVRYHHLSFLRMFYARTPSPVSPVLFFLRATFQYQKANIKCSLCRACLLCFEAPRAPHLFSIQPCSWCTMPLFTIGGKGRHSKIKPICLFIVFMVLAVCGDSTIAQRDFREPAWGKRKIRLSGRRSRARLGQTPSVYMKPQRWEIFSGDFPII